MGVSIAGLGFTCPSGPGISTFPSGNFGYIFEVAAIGAANSFSAYVGVSTLAHTYVSGGTVKINVTRPFDGQVVFFDELYYTIGSVSVGSISIVEPASYGVNSYKTLRTEIDAMKEDLSKQFGVYRYTNY